MSATRPPLVKVIKFNENGPESTLTPLKNIIYFCKYPIVEYVMVGLLSVVLAVNETVEMYVFTVNCLKVIRYLLSCTLFDCTLRKKNVRNQSGIVQVFLTKQSYWIKFSNEKTNGIIELFYYDKIWQNNSSYNSMWNINEILVSELRLFDLVTRYKTSKNIHYNRMK